MKKIFTLAAAFMATAVSFQAAADSWTVTDKTEFLSAWGNLGRTTGARDTIYLAEGFNADLGTIKNFPIAGKFWVIGQTGESGTRPVMLVNFDAESPTEENSDLGFYFENVSIQFNKGGASAGSGQLFYFNKKYFDVDSIVFRNVEFTNYPRTIYRSVPPQVDGVYQKAGTVYYFEMSNCIVHNANVLDSNKWPAIYFGQVPIEIVFKNNTFYDLPYLKYIFNINYISDENGRSDGTLTF